MENIHILKNPPDQETLRQLWEQSDYELEDFFNKRGKVYREKELKDKLPQMSVEEKLELLASEGKLIKRPIVTDGKKVTLGFRESLFADVWGA